MQESPQPMKDFPLTRSLAVTAWAWLGIALCLPAAASDAAAGPGLKLSLELPAPKDADPQQRAQAAALWKVLSAAPEDAVRQGQRLQTLESELQTLAQVARRNDEAARDMRFQVSKARSERYANPLVYFLAGLVLTLPMVAFWLWRREHHVPTSSRAWWRFGAGPPTDFDTSSLPPRARGAAGPQPLAASAELDPVLRMGSRPDPSLDLGLDLDLGEPGKPRTGPLLYELPDVDTTEIKPTPKPAPG